MHLTPKSVLIDIHCTNFGVCKDTDYGKRLTPPLVWNIGSPRDVQFEGGSKEAGWQVFVARETDIGGAQVMAATVDLGQRVLTLPRAQGISSTRGFAGKTIDNIDVVLRIYPGACSDGMTNQIYAAKTTLTIGEKIYEGCGRFLND